MSWPAIAIYAVVAFVGLPSATRNSTALGLSLAWLLGEITWLLTSNNLPVSTYFMADVAVITLIYAKTIRRVGSKIYPSLAKQLYCLVADLTVWDRWIVALFVFGAWPLYIATIHPYYKWWSLWAIIVAQILLAGAEAIQSFRHELKQRAASDPPGHGLALVGVRTGHGR
jgi:hypothetical protein